MARVSNGVVLVTGGAGYIGTHTLVELLNGGWEVLVLDNFSNSHPMALERVKAITGRTFEVVEADVRDVGALDLLFARQQAQGKPVTCVLHLAALKAVGESVSKPLEYYDNNVVGSIRLLQAMRRAGVRQFVFSSSATVYGEPQELPYTESHRIAPTNPYGATKAAVEQILADESRACSEFRAVVLRYFNPIGAHPSGLIGEDPQGEPNNLFPYITRVAAGVLPVLHIFGDDYDTPDGTGVRDYLHVMDLAAGHVRAIEYAERAETGFTAVNLGTGKGTSVLQLVQTFTEVTGVDVPRRVVARRPGDIAAAWADPSLASRLLGWESRFDLRTMCADGWRWQAKNPRGYAA